MLWCKLSFGQHFELKHSTQLSFVPMQASIDKKGGLYLADVSGNIYKYGTNGNLTNHYSTKQIGKIYLIEAFQGLRPFVFYQDLQEILMLDRFLANERKFTLSSLPFVRVATLAQDQALWLLLENDLTLIKLRMNDNIKLIENQWANEFVNDALNITSMREYKNRLYLFDQGRRLIVFDNLGNIITTIEAHDSSYFFFDEDSVYFLIGRQLEIVNINNLERKTIQLPQKTSKIQISGNIAYLIFENTLNIYNYSPL